MRNIKIHAATVRDVMKRPNDITGAARDGWNDVVDGLGYRDSYETASRCYQSNYERGRLAAIETRATERWTSQCPITIPEFVRPGLRIVREQFPFTAA